jgi:hypothetical protein
MSVHKLRYSVYLESGIEVKDVKQWQHVLTWLCMLSEYGETCNYLIWST